ncbi:50S ribosomal protein L20 [bacterium]|jgi:large subunit ribosomal protein L20|nr:50S ribosomal protein L20 [bacterium]
MPRVKRGNKRRQKRKKLLALASGYRLTKGKLYRAAREAVQKGLAYAYRDRRNKKRDFRSLWIIRINAEARKHEISYSRLIAGLKKAGINLNRKMLAEIAVSDAAGFAHLAQIAKTA